MAWRRWCRTATRASTSLRGELVPPGPGQANGLLDLGGFYGLHPSLANLHTMFQAGELLPVHAVVGPTRVRSHFEAQDCLESGADHRMTSGWLNRAVAALPGAAHGRPEGDALAIGVSVPLLLRGPATVGSWAPHGVMAPPADLYTQIAALNQRRPDHRPGDRRGAAGARLHRCRAGQRRRPGAAGQAPLRFPGAGAGRPARCCARRTGRASPRWRSAAGTPTRRRCRGWPAC